MATLLTAVVALGLVVCSIGTALAQSIHPDAVRQIEAIIQEKMSRTPEQQKLDSHLHLAGQSVRGAVTSATVPSLSSAFDVLEFDEAGDVHVDIQGAVTPGLLAEIVALGGTVESSYPSYGAIRAWIPLAAAETLAARPDVTFIKPAAKAVTNVRPINTRALASHGVDAALALGFTGSGVKVGVLSDGVRSLASLQAAANLPVVTVLSGQTGPVNGDEGTAILEIVHDLAPGAQLYFATAFNSEASFATNIQGLANAGCKIIVDDVSYLDEGAFQDGIVARAVNTVTAAGVLYFSAAGNSGNLDSGTSGIWEGDFVPGAPIPALGNRQTHSFDATHNYNQVIGASPFVTTLKWSDPLGASCNDYDLFVLNSTLTTVLASSTTTQNCSQDPFEQVPPPPPNSRIVVVRFSGAARALRVDTSGGRLAIGTNGATFGHNAAASAVTVAATRAQSSIFTNGNHSPEPYSSDGPRKIFYFPNGTAITPGNVLFGTNGGTTLPKVDLMAADCGQSAVAGFSTFCGTSAAAPTAAAIAALVMSANPGSNASQVLGLMRSTALAAVAGFSPSSVGSGIVMANLAVAGAGTRRLSGRITDAFATGIAGVSVNLAGASSDGTVTDAVGNYQFMVQANGGYTVTPTSAGLAFAPGGRSVQVGTQDVGGLDFGLSPAGDAVNAFVVGLYAAALGRAPDPPGLPPGLAFWTGLLRQQCNLTGLTTVADGFFDSGEFRLRALTLPGLATALYRSVLARDPEPAGLTAAVAFFRANRLGLALFFVGSPEFQSLLPDRTNRSAVSAVITRFYTEILGRAPAASEVTGWVNYIVATRDVEGTVAVFLTSPEFEQRALTFRDYVAILFASILGRSPGQDGFDYWEGVLRSQLLQVLNGSFLPSGEFQGRIPPLCGN